MTVTIVTGLIAPSTVQKHRKTEFYFDNFQQLVEAGFEKLIVFISDQLLEFAQQKFPSVNFVPVIFEELETYKLVKSHEYTLPESRAEDKDTENYFITINSKTELVARAIRENTTPTSHYCWVDFGIAYISPDPRHLFAELKRKLSSPGLPVLALPGCWPGAPPDTLSAVCWRFCGGFFIGEVAALLDFATKAREELERCLVDHKRLLWEVNVWTRLEQRGEWQPTWYWALHDGGMFGNLDVKEPSLVISIQPS